MQETQVQSLGQEDPLEEEMATHSSNLAWRIPRTEELGGLQSMGSQRVGHGWVNFSFTLLAVDTKNIKQFYFPNQQVLILLYFLQIMLANASVLISSSLCSWVDQKVHLSFSVTSCRKTQMNFLTNPIYAVLDIIWNFYPSALMSS